MIKFTKAQNQKRKKKTRDYTRWNEILTSMDTTTPREMTVYNFITNKSYIPKINTKDIIRENLIHVLFCR